MRDCTVFFSNLTSNKWTFLLSVNTGDASKQVHMEGYAVSGQCMALVRDNCLVPTKDAPELGYIRESGDKQYVPDVYYKVSTHIFHDFPPVS